MVDVETGRQLYPLFNVGIGTRFFQPDTKKTGVLVDRNESEAHIRVINPDSTRGHLQYWASGTLVVPLAMEASSPALPQAIENLVCPKCRKECTSRSGLTLHVKSCTGILPGEVAPAGELRCDICGKKCSSKPGLTLHKKSAHKSTEAAGTQTQTTET